MVQTVRDPVVAEDATDQRAREAPSAWTDWALPGDEWRDVAPAVQLDLPGFVVPRTGAEDDGGRWFG